MADPEVDEAFSRSHLLDLAPSQQHVRDCLVARVTQQELADAVGSVREVVARVLRDFRQVAS